VRAEAQAFADCIEGGGVAVFPADTVYGLACDPLDVDAVVRLYALKRRRPDKPAATMWFDRERALAALPHLGPRTRSACERLLPGPVTLLLPDPAGSEAALGVRVPVVPLLAGVPCAVLQSSANHAGGADPRTVEDVPADIRAGADLVLDAGPLPGTPSTVVDLRGYESGGRWALVRAGALAEPEVAKALGIVSSPP
jgi:L-threonylcarbamoyladenylate synthase